MAAQAVRHADPGAGLNPGAAVGVVGASARAAAMSLARAGFAAWAVDLFADRDLRRIAPVARCPADRYPESLPDLADQFPPGPVLYTGGLENHPHVVADLARRRELWGNPPDVLAQVRDPFRLRDILHGKAFDYPRVLPPGAPLPHDGRWLRKPLHSAGGQSIRFARPDDEPSASHYLQEFVPGPAMSALFTSIENKCHLSGVTEQLCGEPWLHARPFQYAGNVGPLPTTADLASELTLLGYRLVMQTGIRGVWGVDFVLNGDRPTVVEVNPRYPASAEVLEHATGAAVFSPSPLAGEGGEWRSREPGEGNTVGKAIYFAPHRIVFPARGPWDRDLDGPFDPWRLPDFADIPDAGETIEPGHPVLTFFSQGSTAGECRAKLMGRAAELDRLFQGQP